jgi:tight adherence protein B
MTPGSLRILLLILVFAAVLFAAQALLQIWRVTRQRNVGINRRLDLIAKGFDRAAIAQRLRRDLNEGGIFLPGILAGPGRKLDNMLRGTGLGISPLRLLLIMVAATILIFVVVNIVALLAGFATSVGTIVMIATFAVVLGLALPLLWLARNADRRRKRLAEQFPVALDIFVRGLRAGHPVAAALELLTVEMSDPIGSEFGLAVDEVTYGADLRDALHNMAERCDLDDMRMFVVSLAIQNETGGNLAEILENLSQVIRERASIALMVRALSSEGRMTGTILTALPLLAFTGLFLVNPRFYLDVSNDRAFIIGFGVLVTLYVIGFVSIRRMVDLKV